tara:strand:- start:1324 stop:2007 length:684 start_codon:yes stop_codon:yes gene_type:complete
MAKKHNTDEEVLVDVTQSISRLEKFFEDNRQSISIVIIAIFAIVGGYISYIKFYQEPREAEAQSEIYHAQHWFEVDSLDQAINGMGDKLGFLDIAADYSGTNAGNLANYYAGISYLRLGEFENAIRILDEFHTDDPILQVISKGAIGDAFMELNQTKEALEYYNKAVSTNSNDYIVPFYLLKAGLAAEQAGENAKALDYFKRIKSDFADSRQGLDIDRYIGRIEAKI